jgi:hypothetical protein
LMWEDRLGPDTEARDPRARMLYVCMDRGVGQGGQYSCVSQQLHVATCVDKTFINSSSPPGAPAPPSLHCSVCCRSCPGIHNLVLCPLGYVHMILDLPQHPCLATHAAFNICSHTLTIWCSFATSGVTIGIIITPTSLTHCQNLLLTDHPAPSPSALLTMRGGLMSLGSTWFSTWGLTLTITLRPSRDSPNLSGTARPGDEGVGHTGTRTSTRLRCQRDLASVHACDAAAVKAQVFPTY